MSDRCSLGISPQTLSDWQAQQVSPEQQRALSQHIADCPACRRVLRSFERLGRELAAPVPTPSQDSIWRGVHNAIIHQESPSMSGRSRLAVIGGGIIASSLVIIFALILVLLPAHPATTSRATPGTATATNHHTPGPAPSATAIPPLRGLVAYTNDSTLAVADAATGTPKWATSIPTGQYQLATGQGRLFVSGVSHPNVMNLHAYDAQSGRLLWTVPQGYLTDGGEHVAYINGTVVAAKGGCFTVCDYSQSAVEGLDPQSGAVRWHIDNNTWLWTIDGIIYLLSDMQGVGKITYSLRAVDGATGQRLWTLNEGIAFPERVFGGNGMVYVDDIQQISPTQQGEERVGAFNARTGSLQWAYIIEQPHYIASFVNGPPGIALELQSHHNGVPNPAGVFLDSATGVVKWKAATPSIYTFAQNQLVGFDYKFQTLTGINTNDGSVLWRTPIDKVNLLLVQGSPLNAYTSDNTSNIASYDPATGQRQWNMPLGGITFGEYEAVGNYLLYITYDHATPLSGGQSQISGPYKLHLLRATDGAASWTITSATPIQLHIGFPIVISPN